ncbi:MAG: GNAT family N-acetyltransferase [Microbacterium sp.]|jgi:RimJ/RimL family protein N-acetyltransferase|nr:GNAT family N-acetyltransferase [Microbacterium sp.]
MIEFTRLTRIPLAEVQELLNEPRNARHMPLADRFDARATSDWVAEKDALWQMHGYGPWAFLVDGRFAGWGGFQYEEGGADFALVLRPEFWGRGAQITRESLDRGFGELGLEEVTIALPETRNAAKVVAKVGFVPDGVATYGESSFQQYRLTRAAWAAHHP